MMRIYLKTSPSSETVPFNYQRALVGAMHKWLGGNDLHDDASLYWLSWLYGGKRREQGLQFPDGAYFFISAPDTGLHQRIANGVFRDADIQWGLQVREIQLQVPVGGGDVIGESSKIKQKYNQNDFSHIHR
ncbi:MAG: hypothetical protein IPN74_02565 [Haliscomenobacter sp.]|nr:hypothetical protein [Haliscomenobacter sp.]